MHILKIFATFVVLTFTIDGGSRDGTLPVFLRGNIVESGTAVNAELAFDEAADSSHFNLASCKLGRQRLQKDAASGEFTVKGKSYTIIGTCKDPGSTDYEVVAISDTRDPDSATVINLVGKVKTVNWDTKFSGVAKVQAKNSGEKNLRFKFGE